MVKLDSKIEKDIKKKALYYMEQSRPGWNVPHLHAAVYYMKKLIENEGGDEKILLPAIYLHDIGYVGSLKTNYNYKESLKPKKMHMKKGSIMAREILNKLDYFSYEEIEKITYLISIHDDMEKIIGYDAQLVFEADSLA